MSTFTITLPGDLLYCPDTGKNIVAGEVMRVELDQTKYPGITDLLIDLTVNSFTQGQVWDETNELFVSGYSYNVTGTLPSDLTQLDQCDLADWWCKSCCDEFLIVTAQGDSVLGSDEITVNLPAGYTTANILGSERFRFLTPTANGAMVMGEKTVTATSIVYKLTGTSNENGGHRITITLRK